LSGIVQTENIIISNSGGIPGQKSVVNTPLINPEKFIYLRCTSNFDSITFVKRWIKIVLYLKNKFPRTSDAEFKEGALVGPQIRE